VDFTTNELLIAYFMRLITKSGFYKTDRFESFLFLQDEPGTTLVSGKDCLLRYFPTAEVSAQIDAVLLGITRDDVLERELFVPKSGFFLDQSAAAGPNLGVLIKAFMIAKPGDYKFSLVCFDKDGKVISSPTLPFFSFVHDIDHWMRDWMPG